MKIKLFIVVIILAVSGMGIAQDARNLSDIGKSTSIQSTTKDFSDNLFYGGEFSASFGDYSQITIQPQIGYKFSNIVATILKVGYSRGWSSNFKDKSGSSLGYDNYGGSLVLRVSPIRQVYGMLEPAYYSYQSPVLVTTSIPTYYDKTRSSVPFIFLGAGFYQPFGNSRAGLTAEIKVDLLNDKNSPYDDWAPMYTVGVVYGF